MSKIRVFAIIFMLVAIAFGKVNSQTAQDQYERAKNGRNVVTTAVPFLMITPDSRSGALGDCGVALPNDPNAIHWNPAKLAFAEDNIGLSISYIPWLKSLVPDINLSYLSAYKRIDDMSAFGGSLRYFSLGDITFTNINGESMGDFRPHELAVDGAYARKLAENFSIGVALRFIYSNLAGNTPLQNGTETKPGIAGAGDISFYWKLNPFQIDERDVDASFGLNISNIGSKITYTDEMDRDYIPMNLRLGGYFNYVIDEYNEIAFTFDVNKLLVPTPPFYDIDSSGNPIYDNDNNPVIFKGMSPDVPVIAGMMQSFYDAPGGFNEEMKEINPSFGFEYWYAKQFAVRAGYFYEHEMKGNRQFLSLGIGMKYNILNLDVSYLIPTNNKTASQTSPLDKTVRFSIIFNFKDNK
ncbi:MAG: type IX secretion system outer membrane channel protein PorV [Bacteroidota bacterium]|nr:type IX secretion system outer membrane channel protein PorV [Bacteroidota bacterium]